ncbi:hypothetical protein LCGC14_3142820, partial [marine sediment metagenome]
TVHIGDTNIDTAVQILRITPNNDKPDNVTVTIYEDCIRSKATAYNISIYMNNGTCTLDSAATLIEMKKGTFNYGTDLGASPETGMDITTLRIHGGSFNWYPDDSGDDAYIGNLYLFGGTFNASATTPIYKTRRWGLTGSVNYQFSEFEFDNLENTSQVNVFEQNGTVDFHNFSAALSSTYFSTLFKKPVIYNASLIVDGNEEGLERVKGLVGLSFILKRTARTTLTLGAIVFIDPTSQIPFFPTFSYNHRFKNSKWEVDFILPQRLLFRRPVGENGRFSIGSTFGATGFYVNVNSPNFADVYEYSQLEIKSGIIYEHRISDYLIGTFQGGLQNFISN